MLLTNQHLNKLAAARVNFKYRSMLNGSLFAHILERLANEGGANVEDEDNDYDEDNEEGAQDMEAVADMIEGDEDAMDPVECIRLVMDVDTEDAVDEVVANIWREDQLMVHAIRAGRDGVDGRADADDGNDAVEGARFYDCVIMAHKCHEFASLFLHFARADLVYNCSESKYPHEIDALGDHLGLASFGHLIARYLLRQLHASVGEEYLG